MEPNEEGELVLVPASWEFAQELFDQKIKLICDEVRATESPLLFLTNTPRINKLRNKERKRNDEPEKIYVENFRHEVAKEKEYKGTRKATKPFHFYNLLNYVLANYDVHVDEQGLEADDAMCIYQIQIAKEYGVKVPFHGGYFLLDYEDWLKYNKTTFIQDNKGYLVNDTGKDLTRKVWLLHREIMGNPEGFVVDHINGNTLDNRKYNLRICTTKENVRNSKPQEGSSAYKGVSWDESRGKWLAGIKVDREHIFLGRYDLELDAAKAYDDAAETHFGVYARLNLKPPYTKPYKETIICSRDKDVRQCPLWHYSWECGKQASVGPILVEPLGELVQINPKKIFGTGAKFFYYQLLVGDTVDNIGGIKGKGPAFAFNLLKDCVSERQCYEFIAHVYLQHHGDEWKTKFREQADLLYMIRELDEKGEKIKWKPPQLAKSEISG